jgi:hypothetical protein
MPISIAKRFNINLKKLLHDNSLQHPGLKAKSKLNLLQHSLQRLCGRRRPKFELKSPLVHRPNLVVKSFLTQVVLARSHSGRVALVVSRLKRRRGVSEHGERAERTALGLSSSAVVERVQLRSVLSAVEFHSYHFSVQLGSVCTVCALSSLDAMLVPRCK